MAQHEDKFEEEFSNWAKAVLGLKEARDGSIKFIKSQTENFAQRLDNMHGPHEGEHFKELMMKVTVRGEVNKLHQPKTKSTLNESHSKALPTIKWVLKDNSCVTCGKIFEEQLDNFEYSWCNCKEWIKSSTEDQIESSSYWWVLAKMYSANSEIVDADGPEKVEPLAIFNLIKHCKLFDLKLRLKVDTLVKLRHKLMHSANDRLTRQEMNDNFDSIKQFLKEVEAETIDEVEKLETSTLVLYDENGEYSKQIKEALQQQDESLNADFKSPEGIRGATIKSLAASKLAIKEERKKSAECEKKHITKYEELLKQKEELERRTKQYQIDALELKLQLETKKNETHTDSFNELKSHIDALELKLQHEIKKNETHMDNLTLLKNNVDTLDSKLQHEIKKNEALEEKFTEQKNIIGALELNLQHEIKKNETHEETFTELKNNIDELQAKYQRELENDTRQEDKLTELMSNINALELKVHSEKKKNKDKFTKLKNKMKHRSMDLKDNRDVQDVVRSSPRMTMKHRSMDLKDNRDVQDVVRSSPRMTFDEMIMQHSNSDVQERVKDSSKPQFDEMIMQHSNSDVQERVKDSSKPQFDEMMMQHSNSDVQERVKDSSKPQMENVTKDLTQNRDVQDVARSSPLMTFDEMMMQRSNSDVQERVKDSSKPQMENVTKDLTQNRDVQDVARSSPLMTSDEMMMQRSNSDVQERVKDSSKPQMENITKDSKSNKDVRDEVRFFTTAFLGLMMYHSIMDKPERSDNSSEPQDKPDDTPIYTNEPITDSETEKPNEENCSGKSNKTYRTIRKSFLQPKKKLQILDPIKSKFSVKFVTSLKKKLKHFDCLIKSTEDVEPDIPLTVVCVNYTRLKRDVKCALKKVNYTEKFVVMIVHPGERKPLSIKLGGYPENIKFIDVEVNEGRIYNSQVNYNAIETLVDYIEERHCFTPP